MILHATGFVIAGIIGIAALAYLAISENRGAKHESRASLPVDVQKQLETVVGLRRFQTGIIALLLMGVAVWWFSSRVEFTDTAISAIKTNIRDAYEKDPTSEVVEIALLRETPRHLAGSVKVRNKLTKQERIGECSATMDDRGASLWQCK